MKANRCFYCFTRGEMDTDPKNWASDEEARVWVGARVESGGVDGPTGSWRMNVRRKEIRRLGAVRLKIKPGRAVQGLKERWCVRNGT